MKETMDKQILAGKVSTIATQIVPESKKIQRMRLSLLYHLSAKQFLNICQKSFKKWLFPPAQNFHF